MAPCGHVCQERAGKHATLLEFYKQPLQSIKYTFYFYFILFNNKIWAHVVPRVQNISTHEKTMTSSVIVETTRFGNSLILTSTVPSNVNKFQNWHGTKTVGVWEYVYDNLSLIYSRTLLRQTLLAPMPYTHENRSSAYIQTNEGKSRIGHQYGIISQEPVLI